MIATEPTPGELAARDFEERRKRAVPLTVVLLTYNSAAVIERTVRAAHRVSRCIVAVDSASTDGTREILERLGCEVLVRPFLHYADQRNWAIDQVAERCEWQLHLDADEVMDEIAIRSVRAAIASPAGCDAFILGRITYFLGRPLRWGGTRNWHLRLFRSGTARCEDRLYDQHFTCAGRVRRIAGWLHDLNVSSLDEWTRRHARWAVLEAEEIARGTAGNGQLRPRLSDDPRERRRLYKGLYYRAPRLLRAGLLFLYRYVVQLGFLDGRLGLVYAGLQVFWFRLLVDAKLLEAELEARRPAASSEVTRAANAG